MLARVSFIIKVTGVVLGVAPEDEKLCITFVYGASHLI